MSVQAVLVDDDPLALLMLDGQLNQLGLGDTLPVGSGQEALQLFRRDPTERVCFVDVHMPGMDGLELIRHLSEETSCVGVVLMSGEGQRILRSAEELARAQGLRVLAALTKPIAVEELQRTLQEFAAPTSVRRVPARPSTFSTSAIDLRRGLAAGELVVHYQPRVSLHSGNCSGFEALARWQHPEGGLIGPAAFISLAETSGLIGLLTRQVFEKGVLGFSEICEEHGAMQLSLNASIDTLAHLSFAEDLAKLAGKHGVPVTSLIVEVTESRLAAQFERVLETLTRLRLKRVGIAIDDFGTGYSSMDQLRRFPFTELKLDRSFVRGSHRDDTTRAILESSVALACQLGMTTVAEGVETREDWDLARRIGCDEAQGYFLAKPLAQAEISPWLRAQHARSSSTSVASCS